MLDLNPAKDYTLLIRLNDDGEVLDTTPQPFIVAYQYDKKTDTWAQGHYFHNLQSAIQFMFE